MGVQRTKNEMAQLWKEKKDEQREDDGDCTSQSKV